MIPPDEWRLDDVRAASARTWPIPPGRAYVPDPVERAIADRARDEEADRWRARLRAAERQAAIRVTVAGVAGIATGIAIAAAVLP